MDLEEYFASLQLRSTELPPDLLADITKAFQEMNARKAAYEKKFQETEEYAKKLQERERRIASSSHRLLTTESLAEFMRSNFALLPFQPRDDCNETVQPLCHSFGGNFLFQERGRNFKQVRSLVKDLFKKITSKKLDKQDFKFPVFHSAPGTGKSRTLDELAVSIRNWLTEANFQKILKGRRVHFIPHTVSFGNGSGTSSLPSFANQVDSDVEPHIAIRMLHSHIENRRTLRPFTDLFIQEFGETNFLRLRFSLALDCLELLYMDDLNENSEHQDRSKLDYFVHAVMIDEYNEPLFNHEKTESFVQRVLTASPIKK